MGKRIDSHGFNNNHKTGRNRSYVDPQHGKISVPLEGKFLLAYQRSERAQRVGRLGEDFIQSTHPHWERMPPANEGYDFTTKRRGREVKIEVKTLSFEDAVANRFGLSCRRGHLANQKADEFYFLSVNGIWKANANDLRRYMEHLLHQFPIAYHRSFHERVNFEVDVDRLVRLKIFQPLNISHRHFHRFMKEKLATKK